MYNDTKTSKDRMEITPFWRGVVKGYFLGVSVIVLGILAIELYGPDHLISNIASLL